MDRLTLEVDEASMLAPGARRFGLACIHGRSNAVFVPATKSFSEPAVFELLLARHHGINRCGCLPMMPGSLPVAGRA